MGAQLVKEPGSVMAIEIKMPALSPTMEEGTLAKWIIAEGDSVRSGDLMAEIETDKATMEFEAVDEGVVSRILVAAGTDNVKVGTVIALLTVDGEREEDGAESAGPAATDTAPVGAGAPESDAPLAAAEARDDHGGPEIAKAPVPKPAGSPPAEGGAGPVPVAADRNPEPAARIKASPLARRIAGTMKVDLAGVPGSGPGGRIVRADVEAAGRRPAASTTAPASGASRAPVPAGLAMPPGAPGATPAAGPTIAIPDIPHRATKLSNVRKVIARRLTESKASVPHIYLTVDIELDALLALRTGLNEVLARRDIKLSVNDLLIKALACALIEVPTCNVMYTPDQLISFSRADISVAVSAPSGLITPIITAADTKPAAVISSEMKELAGRAREGKLAPHEYQGGTASLSNMGMFGIRAFDAVINPPQAMIMAIGAGEQRAWVSKGVLGIATIMSATGSFDHRAVDGADGAALMQAFKRIVEQPLGLLA